MRQTKFTLEELRQYMEGWLGTHDRPGDASLNNALHMLDDEHDGIEATLKRRKKTTDSGHRPKVKRRYAAICGLPDDSPFNGQLRFSYPVALPWLNVREYTDDFITYILMLYVREFGDKAVLLDKRPTVRGISEEAYLEAASARRAAAVMGDNGEFTLTALHPPEFKSTHKLLCDKGSHIDVMLFWGHYISRDGVVHAPANPKPDHIVPR